MHKIIAAAIVMQMLASPAFATENGDGQSHPHDPPKVVECQNAITCGAIYNSQMHDTAHMPPEWYSCKDSSECTVVSGSCTESVGVNIKYKTEALAAVCKIESCLGTCRAKAIQATSAICRNGKCAPDYESRMKELFPQK